VTRLDNPDGTAVNVFYGPWTRDIVDEDGSDKREISDGFGRLVRVDEYNRAGQTATTRYRYDGANQLIAIIDAGDTDAAAQNPDDPSRLTEFKHDGQGNRLEITRPDGRTWKYGYDRDGNMSRRTDPDGRETEFHYDIVDRIYQKLPSQSLLNPGEAQNLGVGPIHYHYDTGTGGNLVGRLAQVQFLAGSQMIPYAQVAYAYDAQGHATSDAWSWNVGPTGAQRHDGAHIQCLGSPLNSKLSERHCDDL
jgi:YD repeat-containing protein